MNNEWKTRWLLLAVITVLPLLFMNADFATPADSAAAKVEAADHPFGNSRPIAGQYIITFRSNSGVQDTKAEAVKLMAGQGKLLHAYSHAIKGFSAQLPDAAVEALRRNPNIQSIDQDQTVSLKSFQNPAPWGLARIDQLDKSSNIYQTDFEYQYNATGAGVYAFVIDTGIRSDHREFTGRILPGFDAVGDGHGTEDCNGHGTHVSGTIGGTTYGVAKGVKIIPVRVLDCTGSGAWSTVIAGVDWVAGSTLRPAVANMSIGGGANDAVDAAVANLIASGVSVAIAAGNSNMDACLTSPARVPAAITVGATTISDTRAFYSNTGPCVDLFAPGTGILSAWNLDSSSTNIISGTSMATPHVTGVAALVLQSHPAFTPADVAAQIISTATPNRVTAASIGTGSPNLFLNSLGGSPPQADPTLQYLIGVQMTGQSVLNNNGSWVARVQLKPSFVYNDPYYDMIFPGATLSGSFSTGGSASCVTDSTGTCTVASPAISASTASSVFTLQTAAGPNLIHDPLWDNFHLTSTGITHSTQTVVVLDTTAPPPPATETVAVQSLASSSAKVGKSAWVANVRVTVRDANTGIVVTGAAVSGAFSKGGSGSCVTDATGGCSLSSTQLKNTITSTTFSVSAISGSNMVYDASKNWASQIAIAKP